jgi:RNA polymerase sigma-70 factor (ECF subfamily)
VTVELALVAAEPDLPAPAPTSSSAPADTELVRRAKAGDARAFDELVLRHHAEMVRLARVVLASDADAEDLAQECWAHAWSRLGELREPSRFVTWLRRSLVRRAIRAARRRVREAGTEAGAALATHAAPEAPAAARIDVEAGLRALSPRQRAVFLLTEVDGYDAAETASRLGIAVATVRVHRLLARRRLRALFEGSSR